MTWGIKTSALTTAGITNWNTTWSIVGRAQMKTSGNFKLMMFLDVATPYSATGDVLGNGRLGRDLATSSSGYSAAYYSDVVSAYPAAFWTPYQYYYFVIKRSAAGIITVQLLNSGGNLILASSTTASYTFVNTSGYFFVLYTESAWDLSNGLVVRAGYDTATYKTYDAAYGALL